MPGSQPMGAPLDVGMPIMAATVPLVRVEPSVRPFFNRKVANCRPTSTLFEANNEQNPTVPRIGTRDPRSAG